MFRDLGSLHQDPKDVENVEILVVLPGVCRISFKKFLYLHLREPLNPKPTEKAYPPLLCANEGFQTFQAR